MSVRGAPSQTHSLSAPPLAPRVVGTLLLVLLPFGPQPAHPAAGFTGGGAVCMGRCCLFPLVSCTLACYHAHTPPPPPHPHSQTPPPCSLLAKEKCENSQSISLGRYMLPFWDTRCRLQSQCVLMLGRPFLALSPYLHRHCAGKLVTCVTGPGTHVIQS